jgi:hypothetical protein
MASGQLPPCRADQSRGIADPLILRPNPRFLNEWFVIRRIYRRH